MRELKVGDKIQGPDRVYEIARLTVLKAIAKGGKRFKKRVMFSGVVLPEVKEKQTYTIIN